MQRRCCPALHVENLEDRAVPAAGYADSFEAAKAPYAPDGWQQWASNGSQYYAVSDSAAATGTQSVAAYGNLGVESRLWQAAPLPGDATLSLAVRADTPAPILLFARGADMTGSAASYVGASISAGGKIELRLADKGTIAIQKTVTPTASANGWLRITASFIGTKATIRVQRLDAQQYLNASGQWQTAAVDAIAISIRNKAASGLVGFGRLSGAYGTAYMDDFSATPIVAAPASVPASTPVPSPVKIPPVSVPPVTVPPVTIQPAHIQIAQLAYSGSNLSATDLELFAKHTDLVVANPIYLNTFETAAAATPKIIYTNSTNIYEKLLSDWLTSADSNGVNREDAFYHVSQATPFTGNSPSARPVTWFWSVTKSAGGASTDLTANAHSSGVTFGAIGESIVLGGIDQFREINLTLSRAAGSDFAGVWESASATGWKTLTLLNDGTKGFTQSGRITFDPPADWSAAGTFAVRFRTTGGSLAPIAASILGRDSVNANGGTSGTIPAFDANADANHDGYLTDAEFAAHKASSDARFVSESRLFYPYYGQMRFVVNPAPASVRSWEGEYHAKLLEASPNADGLFIDNANGKLPFAGTPVLEATANYNADSAAVVAAIKQAIGNRTIVANTSGGGSTSAADAITREAGIAFEEFALRPTTANWSAVNDVAAVVARRLSASPTAKVILDSHPGGTAMTDPRTQTGVLSYYYLLADPSRTYLMFFGGFAPTASWTARWSPAAEVNVGKPKAAMTTFASGLDPQNNNLQYKVYGREYENALILQKPLSYTLGKGTGTTDDATATMHVLNGNYRLLNNDGTLGPVITSINLRNGEGAILMKA